jgi:hypothetical protein
MKALGEEAREECRVYFCGGSSAVLEGWRDSTVDADLRIVPDSIRLLEAVPRLKEELRLNVELAAPSDFIPELPGWRERSRFIRQEGRVSFFHYDFYAQALSKVERGARKDRMDVAAMVERGLVEPAKAWELFERIVPELHRYPAIEPDHFRAAMVTALGAP